MMSWFSYFQNLFLPRRYIQSLKGVSRPSGKGPGPRQWVIARSLCLHRVFLLGDIPPEARKNALNIRIRQWTPFTDTGSYVVWSGETAQVWIWDESKRREAAKAAGADISRMLPETVLRQPSDNDTLRLISCADGFEAQIWKHGILSASHWWANRLPMKEWIRFLVAHDLDPRIKVPAPETAEWLNRPWGKTADRNLLSDFPREKLWVSLAMAMLIFVLIWQGVSVCRWHRGLAVIQERIDILSQEAEPVLEARNQAEKYRQIAEHLISLATAPAQLELMAAVGEKIPPKKARLAEWHYNQGNLIFTLKGENLDPRYYVKNYQALPRFKEVTAEPGTRPGELVVKLRIEN